MKFNLITLVAAVALGVGGYYVYQNYFSQVAATKMTTSKGLADVGKGNNVKVQFPVPKSIKASADDDDADSAVPSLDKSDESISAALAKLTDKTLLEQLFNSKDFIRSVVVTVVNLTKERVPTQFLPVKSPTGDFVVDKKTHTISKENFARYSAYVDFAEKVNINKLGRLYVKYYPLFQQVYAEDNRGYFNDKVIEVLDSLLKTPEVKESPKVKKAIVSYKYQDHSLESLNAGQKILVRMGPENAERMRKVLKQLRTKLAKLSDET